MTRVVYDAGVLVAADRNVRTVWADHRIRLEAGIVTGDRADIHRLLQATDATSEIIDL